MVALAMSEARLDRQANECPGPEPTPSNSVCLAFDSCVTIAPKAPAESDVKARTKLVSAGQVDWENAYSTLVPQITAEGVHEWPFDPLFPIDIRFLVFGRHGDIRLNRHDYFEVLIVLSGEISCQVQERSFTLGQGDVFVIGSTLHHRMWQDQGRGKAVILYFLPRLIRSAENADDSTQYLMPFLMQDSFFPHVIDGRSLVAADVLDWVRRIRPLLPPRSALDRLRVKTYLKMILVLLAEHFNALQATEESFKRRERDLQRLRPLFDFIDKHYSQVITIEDAAAMLYMSKSHFMRFFKRVTGQAFLTQLNRFRLAKAQALIASTDKTIAEISQEVGFCDQSYFGLIFRRLVGMTPRQYKRFVQQTAAQESAGEDKEEDFTKPSK